MPKVLLHTWLEKFLGYLVDMIQKKNEENTGSYP